MEENPLLPTAIMVMDLDGLKQVNDSLGHAAGDALLRAAAEIFQKSLPADATLARIGGDEFTCLLPRTDFAAAEALRMRILDEVDAFNALNPTLPVGISIGFSVAETSPLLMRDLFKEADSNMYLDKDLREQKTGGRKSAPRAG